MPSRLSIETISASAMPGGPPTCTSFSVTVSSGKKSSSGSPRSDTSRPVQAAICSPTRVFSASRGKQHDEQHEERRGRQDARRQDPCDALHCQRLPSSRRPGDRGWPRRRQGRPLGARAGLWQSLAAAERARNDDDRRTALDARSRLAWRGSRSRPSGRGGAAGRAPASPITTRCTPGRSRIPAPSGTSSGISAASSARRASAGSSRAPACARRASSPTRG